jgi:predicted RNA-binding Zn-ribbon protein involved in translation (DUF1610 family)
MRAGWPLVCYSPGPYHGVSLSLFRRLQYAARNLKGDEPMVALRCPCGGEHEIWGELWWVGGTHEWVYFDDLETSETHTEQITHCPGCGRQLERKNLKTVGTR